MSEGSETFSPTDHQQKSNPISPSKMSDENRDPSSKSVTSNKIRPKPVDARSAAAAASSRYSSIDSPKSATITNVSQRLPSTSVEVSVGDILYSDEKRASVSIRHSSSSCSSSDIADNNDSISNQKMDLGEATRELTRLLHIGHENHPKEIHLNPDAPDFTPLDFSPTYRSELAPAHLHRRATQVDYYNNRYSRSRYYSESYNHSTATTTNTSTIRPLLSLVPQYNPNHRQSWTITSPPSASSNSWWQYDYSNPSSSSSSYHSRPAYPLYSPLMGPLTDDLYRHSSKRARVQSNRAFIFPSHLNNNRKRSHSGPDTPLQPAENHLNGIHSLARIMVDILRMIDPLPTVDQEKLFPSNTNVSSYQQQIHSRTTYQPESNEAEEVFIEDSTVNINETAAQTETFA